MSTQNVVLLFVVFINVWFHSVTHSADDRLAVLYICKLMCVVVTDKYK